LPYARAVAERYHTEHHQIDLGELQVGALLETMAQVYDEPFADSSHIPTYLICGFARRHVKVVLSGDGGDEMFGGYGRYLALAASETLGSSILMWYGLRALSRLLRERVAALHTYSVAAGMAYRWSDPAVRCAMSQVSIREPQRRSLWGKSRHLASPQHKTFVALPEAALTGLNRAFHFDLTCYLPGDILVKVDRAAMAHGLETRAPFLDRDLAEFVLRLPPGLKVRDRQTKILFRKACESLWPETIRLRRKQGFGGPYGRWFQRPDVQGLFRRVTRRNGPLRALLPGLSVQPLPPTYATWILLTLGLWLENNQNAL
jgi:asparagine synthase (glutamine-hydrolysing)